MSLSNVKEYLKNYNLENKIQTFNESSATVELAAKALNTEEKRIAKTMAFTLKDNSNILVVIAGNAKISNSKFKQTFNSKAHMVPIDKLEEVIGHPIGGVCPFAVNNNVKVYLDESLKEFETVFPACGTPASAIELTIGELEATSNYISWVDISEKIL